MRQPQWSGDGQDVAEEFYNKFADRKNSQSALSGREPFFWPGRLQKSSFKISIFPLAKTCRRRELDLSGSGLWLKVSLTGG